VDGKLLFAIEEKDLRELGMTSGLMRKKVLVEVDLLRAKHSMDRCQLTPELRHSHACMLQPHFDTEGGGGGGGSGGGLGRKMMEEEVVVEEEEKVEVGKERDMWRWRNRERSRRRCGRTSDIASRGGGRKRSKDGSKGSGAAPMLVVSGGGGAFLHPTHVPGGGTIHVAGKPYVRVAGRC